MATEVVRLHSEVQRRLWHSWHDETDLMLAAADAAGPELAAQLGTIVVFLPERLSPAAAALVAAVARVADVRVLVGSTGDERADQSVRRLAAGLADRSELDPDAVHWPLVAPIDAHVDVVSISDADDEVRVAVRRIIRAAHEGVAFERIAVLWTVADPYARAVTGALDAAGVPWNGPSPSRLAERLAGRAMLGLLAVDRFGFRRRDLFAWLATTPVRDNRKRPVPTAIWERISRDAGVSGRGDWSQRLSRWADAQRATAAQSRAVGDESRAERIERDADSAGDLAHFVGWLIDELGAPGESRRWDAWGKWSHRMLSRLLGSTAARLRLPADEQEAIELVEAAIDRLAGLDEVAPRVNRAGFASALEAELDAALGRVGRIGDGVLLGPLSSAIGLHAEVTIVLGAVDGRLPAPPPSDPLIGDHDRVLVPLMQTGGDIVSQQRRHLIAALRSAPDVMVGVPRGDLRRSAQQTASRWLDELVPAGSRHDLHQQSFTHGLGALEFPATAAEHRVRSLLAHVRAGSAIDTHGLLGRDSALRRNLLLVRARESAEFTEYDGNLGAASVPVPFGDGRVMSPTQLERWAGCPHRYFVERLLGVSSIEDRDDDLRMNVMDRGSLLHTVFDEFLQLVITEQMPCPEPNQPWPEEYRQAAFDALDTTAESYESAGLTGRALLWRFDRNRLRSELRRWLDRDDIERAAFATRPVGSEQRFGFPDSPWPAAIVELPTGEQLRFRGSIDRLDRSTDGHWHVTDHKTGTGSQYSTIRASNPVDGGKRLQLGIYAAAVATQHGVSPIGMTSEYSFTARTKGPARNGFEITPEIWSTFVEALSIIVDGMSRGLFPPKPKQPSFFLGWVECPVCDPDGLGTAEGYRAWLRKRDDPRLAPVLALEGVGRA
jgi:ATP-dependent helicase/nuclease subunit B